MQPTTVPIGHTDTERLGSFSIYTLPLLLTLFVSIIFPVGLAPVRLGLLIVAAVAGILSVTMSTKWSVSPRVRRPLLAGIFVCLLAGLWGILNDNPGALPTLRVQVAWPVLFLVAIPAIRRSSDLHRLLRWLDWATIGASGVTLLVVATAGNPFGGYTTTLLGDLAVSGDATHQQVNLTTTLWLIFLFPYAICRIAARLAAHLRPSPVMMLSLLLAAGATVFSGQRSIYVAGAVGLIVAMLNRHSELIPSGADGGGSGLLASRKKRTGLLVPSTLLAISVSIYVYLGGANALTSLASKWQGSSIADSLRSEQVSVLWNNFLLSPIIGHGSGYVAPELQRNTDFPWSYEILPLSTLMALGIVGSAVLFGSIGYMFLILWRESRGPWSALVSPLLAGSLAAAVASTVNPLVTKLGTIWMLLIPLLAIQVIDSVRRDTTLNSQASGGSQDQFD